MKSKLIDSFTDYIVNDQLMLLRVMPRKMFGGVGLYVGTVFFGAIWKDDLYFKTDEQTRLRYVQAGMKPFRPNAKQTLKSYYQVPGEVIEHQDELVAWARQAISCAKNENSSK